MNEPQQNQQHESPIPPQPQIDPVAAAQLSSINDPRRKSPFLAGLLSVMPGLGQVYVGYYQRGFVHAMVIALLIALLVGQAEADFTPLIPFTGLFLTFFWLYNIVDASRRATLYNEVLAGRAGIRLPEEIELSGFGELRGSVPGGVAMVVFGVIMLSHTLLDFSLRWVGEWWPMAFVAFGAYLVYRARQDQHGGSENVYDE